MKKQITLLTLLSLFLIVSGCGEASSQDAGSLKISSDVSFDDNDYEKIISPNNELGFELLDKIDANDDDNTFISPMSLYMALSMVYSGADGSTKKEIADILHSEDIRPDDLIRANASLMSMLDDHTEDNQLNIANSIWLNEKYSFKDDFIDINEDYFNAKVQEIDVSDDASADDIDDWVKKATNDKIDDMVGDSLDPQLVTLLVDAIYFQGDWTYPFDEDATKKESFHLKDGSTKDVPMMHMNETLPYIENSDFQAVSLPYGEDENICMNVFLPKEDIDMDDFKQKITQEHWNEWRDDFSETEVSLSLPTFQSDYEITLNDTLKELGMTSVFKDADFSEMVEGTEELLIDEVKQKTFLNVNEKGTEAAASTSVSVNEMAVQTSVDMTVDRPFVVIIQDDKTGVILFMGTINNPQKG